MMKENVVPKPTLKSTLTPKENAALIAATPILAPRSKSEFYSTRVPIPVPNSAPQSMVAIARSPKSEVSSLLPRLPAPLPLPGSVVADELALENPVQLPSAPMPILALLEEQEVKTLPLTPAGANQPRRHYVVNAGTSTDLNTLFPIEPAAATVPVQKKERLAFSAR